MQYMGLVTPYSYRDCDYMIETAIDGFFYWYFNESDPSDPFDSYSRARSEAENAIDYLWDYVSQDGDEMPWETS